jgi:hypothetical protein
MQYVDRQVDVHAGSVGERERPGEGRVSNGERKKFEKIKAKLK